MAQAQYFVPLVDRDDPIPGAEGFFNSYNPPAIDSTGMVAFRARGSGGTQGSAGVQGVYQLNSYVPHVVQRIADRTTLAPPPNPAGGLFRAFPAVPRIDQGKVVFRGVTQPTAPEAEGNIGVFTTATTDGSALATAVDRTETAPPLNELNFDQFPGAPDIMTVNGTSVLVFKGNSSVEVDELAPAATAEEPADEFTGVYYRVLTPQLGQVYRIADTTMTIPKTAVNFGSTAPPSAANNNVVFVGYDVEAAPTVGGIYGATLQLGVSDPLLTELVPLGKQVAGPDGPVTITRISESLSFDGATCAFHAEIEFPPASEGESAAGGEGIFTVSFHNPSDVRLIADTRTEIPDGGGDFVTFLFETGRGQAADEGDGMGHGGMGHDGSGGDGPPPSEPKFAPFVAVDSGIVVFQAVAPNGVIGIYAMAGTGLTTVIDTTMDGGILDPDFLGVPITDLGIERDAISRGRLVFLATIGDTETEDVTVASEEETDDFQTGLYLTTVSAQGLVTVFQYDAAVFVLGDNYHNNVSVYGINLPWYSWVYVRSEGPQWNPGLGYTPRGQWFYGIRQVHVDLGRGNDRLDVLGELCLGYFYADGGKGQDVLSVRRCFLDSPSVTLRGFETVIVDPLEQLWLLFR